MSIQTFEGPEMNAPYLGDYFGEAFVFLVGDQYPDNNVTTFQYSPEPLASLNVVIQHDGWPESEQWKLFKEGQTGSSFTGVNYYAAGGSNTPYPYDTFVQGFTDEPLLTHDEVCLTGGCYGGWFRHFGYASTQELYSPANPDYEGLVCGVDVYVERGFDVDTLYSYHITAWDEEGGLNLLNEDDNYEYMLGSIGGPSTTWEYPYCVEDSYPELVGDFEDDPQFSCLGDFNQDGDIQLQDLLMICAEMGMGGPECVCDMDGDEWVGVEDFAQFLQVYGSDCEGNQLPPPTVRQLEELDLNPTYLTMEGRRVSAGPVARGAYIAEFEVNGVKNWIKVIL